MSLNTLNNALDFLRTNKYASNASALFLIVYAGVAAPALPEGIAKLFDHAAVKVLVMTLVLVLLQKQNVTTAVLVAIGFVISLNTLSKYRMVSAANDVANEVLDTLGSLGPHSNAGDSNVAKWSSNGTHHYVSLRGHTYEHEDEPHLLPGGHGDLEANASGNGDGGDAGVAGYVGGDYATIGQSNSQL